MRGFDSKALVLFPAYPDYDEKGYEWKRRFNKSVENIVAYLNSIGMSAHFMYTDDVARELRQYVGEWVCPLSKADRFFASKHCFNMGDAMSTPMLEFPELYAEIARKDMVGTDATEVERFNMVTRHLKAACVKIIPDYKVVIHFMKKSKSQYKVVTKPGDNKIRINVDADTFVPTCIMSGYEVDICEALNAPYANRAMYLWEVSS